MLRELKYNRFFSHPLGSWSSAMELIGVRRSEQLGTRYVHRENATGEIAITQYGDTPKFPKGMTPIHAFLMPETTITICKDVDNKLFAYLTPDTKVHPTYSTGLMLSYNEGLKFSYCDDGEKGYAVVYDNNGLAQIISHDGQLSEEVLGENELVAVSLNGDLVRHSDNVLWRWKYFNPIKVEGLVGMAVLPEGVLWCDVNGDLFLNDSKITHLFGKDKVEDVALIDGKICLKINGQRVAYSYTPFNSPGSITS